MASVGVLTTAARMHGGGGGAQDAAGRVGGTCRGRLGHHRHSMALRGGPIRRAALRRLPRHPLHPPRIRPRPPLPSPPPASAPRPPRAARPPPRCTACGRDAAEPFGSALPIMQSCAEAAFSCLNQPSAPLAMARAQARNKALNLSDRPYHPLPTSPTPSRCSSIIHAAACP